MELFNEFLSIDGASQRHSHLAHHDVASRWTEAIPSAGICRKFDGDFRNIICDRLTAIPTDRFAESRRVVQCPPDTPLFYGPRQSCRHGSELRGLRQKS